MAKLNYQKVATPDSRGEHIFKITKSTYDETSESWKSRW